MATKRAFTLIELLVVIAIIAVLIGLIFPAIGAAKRMARRQENNSLVRNAIQSMLTYSESRRGFLPGFDGFAFDDNSAEVIGNSAVGQTAEARYWVLLDGNYTTGDALISPSDLSKNPWIQDEVEEENYSFALLQLATSLNLDPANSPNDRFRREEWRNEQNPLAPLVSDRLAYVDSVPTIGTLDEYMSIHDGSSPGKWAGSIGYGDLHVDFNKTTEVDTRFAEQRNLEDDIFDDSYSVVNPGDVSDKNAVMTFTGTSNPIGIID